MKLAWSVALVALVACGGKAGNGTIAPLPPDPSPSQTPAPAQPEAPVAKQEPRGPLEVTIPAQQTSVKLVAKGRGRLAPLRYTPKAGNSQQVELRMDFTARQTEGTTTDDQIIPTMVLRTETETQSVDAAGTATFALKVTGTDAVDVTGAKVTADQFRQVMASLAGMVIGGTVDATGAPGDLKLRVEQPGELTEGALELLRITLPAWPVLPKEPIGLGAKWQATTTAKLADKLVVTQVTDYELTAHKGATWTIKGTTKVTGADQTVDNGQVSAITGAGTAEVALADGTLFPSHKAAVETHFTASEGDKSIKFALRVAGEVVATAAPAATPGK